MLSFESLVFYFCDNQTGCKLQSPPHPRHTHTHTHTHTQFFNELLLILRRDLLSRSTGDGLRQRVQSGSCSEAEMGLDVLK